MQYMNVLKRATVCDNLGEEKKKQKTLVFELSVSYLIDTQHSWSHILHVIIYIHRILSKSPSRPQLMYNQSSRSQKGSCTWFLQWEERLKNQEIQNRSSLFKASLIKRIIIIIKKQQCSPDITVQSQYIAAPTVVFFETCLFFPLR